MPAGIRRPMMTFSFRPTSSSFLPRTAASVSTRVVFWNDAADRKLSVASDASVMPSSTQSAVAWLPLMFWTRVFSSSKTNLSTIWPGRNRDDELCVCVASGAR